MDVHGELAPEEHVAPEQEREVEAMLHRLRIEGLRRQSLTEPDPPRLRWRLLIGLTCGHRYWVRRDRWRYTVALHLLYCPVCDVGQPVTVASQRKVRKRMALRTDDLRGAKDRPRRLPRIGQEPRKWRGSRPILDPVSLELHRASNVEPLKPSRGMRVELVCGHVVRLDADRVRLAVDPGVLECPEGDGRQRVTPVSVSKAKIRLGF